MRPPSICRYPFRSAPSLVGGGSMQYLASGGASRLTTAQCAEDRVAPAQQTAAGIHCADVKLPGAYRLNACATRGKEGRKRFIARAIIPVVAVSASAVHPARCRRGASMCSSAGDIGDPSDRSRPGSERELHERLASVRPPAPRRWNPSRKLPAFRQDAGVTRSNGDAPAGLGEIHRDRARCACNRNDITTPPGGLRSHDLVDVRTPAVDLSAHGDAARESQAGGEAGESQVRVDARGRPDHRRLNASNSGPCLAVDIPSQQYARPSLSRTHACRRPTASDAAGLSRTTPTGASATTGQPGTGRSFPQQSTSLSTVRAQLKLPPAATWTSACSVRTR